MRHLLLLLVAALSAIQIHAAEHRAAVFTIDDEIDAAAWLHTRNVLHDIASDGRDVGLVMLRLNTYGGAVDVADSIRTALMRLRIPTAVYIDHNAASAGALISLACDTILMAPDATIGAATVVDGAGDPMPEKYQSYWSSIMRATAMAHGKYIPEGDSVARWRRNPDLAADMVRPDKAVAFTASEAVDNGLADGIAPTLNEALASMGYSAADAKYYESSTTELLLGFLASAAVRAILITLILGGIYFEMHTPGLGVAGGVALVAAALYFLPLIVTGTMAAWVVILFILGIVLLAFEIFVIPGFGICGISGIASIIVSLLGAMLYSFTGNFDTGLLGRASIVLGSAIVLTIGLAWLITSRFAPKGLRRITSLTHEQKTEMGYIGVDTAPAALTGHTGVAVTALRPAGKVEIDGCIYDASSTGEFIDAGARIRVVRYETSSIFVVKEP